MNSLGKKVKAESNEYVERDWIMVKEGRQKKKKTEKLPAQENGETQTN